MKVNELSKRTGINLETIRYYEKQGILPEPKRLANGYRSYNEESVAQLIFIKKLSSAWFFLWKILNNLTNSNFTQLIIIMRTNWYLSN